MNRRFFPALWMLAAVTVTMGSTNTNALANIPTCDLHNGMRIWFLDYADDDYTLSHPLGVLTGIVDINERTWHSKCIADGPNTKIFVPFNYRKSGKASWDTRWPQDVYRTRAEAERAYRAKL
jgi:hypothetical protein